MADSVTSPARLAALQATGLMDSAPEAAFDRLALLATRLLAAPVALVSLVDGERQFFKSAIGLDGSPAQRGTPLSHSFCRHVVARNAPLIVDEARHHPLVRDNPAITALGVMAYLGTPLATEDGHVLGTLCVIDTVPRRWSGTDLENLQLLAHSVTSEISLRRMAQQASQTVAQREQAEDALRQTQKMEAIGQLTGGIAHDFNNMLTGITGSLEMLKRRIENGRIEEMPHFVDTALGSATRAANLTHRLLAFARRQSLDPKPVDTNRLILSLADLFRQTFGEGIEMVFELAPALPPAFCDASQLETALLDLAANARDALGVAGRFTIETLAAKTSAGDGQLVIRIGDTGSGMPPEAVTRAFEPFFTTKPTGRGTGLGLSTVHGFVMQSGGHVTIDSTPGIGTLVTLHLPCADTPEPAAVVPAAIPEPIATAGRELLVVEDDPAVRQLIVELLMALGHGVTAVEDGTAAVPILTDVGHAIDLLITDVGLPGLNGRQVAEIGRQHRPELPVLFVTGYAHQARMRGDFLGAGMEMVTKPFALDALLTKVSAMLARG